MNEKGFVGFVWGDTDVAFRLDLELTGTCLQGIAGCMRTVQDGFANESERDGDEFASGSDRDAELRFGLESILRVDDTSDKPGVLRNVFEIFHDKEVSHVKPQTVALLKEVEWHAIILQGTRGRVPVPNSGNGHCFMILFDSRVRAGAHRKIDK